MLKSLRSYPRALLSSFKDMLLRYDRYSELQRISICC